MHIFPSASVRPLRVRALYMQPIGTRVPEMHLYTGRSVCIRAREHGKTPTTLSPPPSPSGLSHSKDGQGRRHRQTGPIIPLQLFNRLPTRLQDGLGRREASLLHMGTAA